MYLHGNRSKERLWAICGVVAVHGLLAYALLSGLAMRVSERASDSLELVDIVLPLPLLRHHRRRRRQASRKASPRRRT